jgi:hypothetical protein
VPPPWNDGGRLHDSPCGVFEPLLLFYEREQGRFVPYASRSLRRHTGAPAARAVGDAGQRMLTRTMIWFNPSAPAR